MFRDWLPSYKNPSMTGNHLQTNLVSTKYIAVVAILFIHVVTDGDQYDFTQLYKQKFIMIKYIRNGRSLPHERVFKMDLENVVGFYHYIINYYCC